MGLVGRASRSFASKDLLLVDLAQHLSLYVFLCTTMHKQHNGQPGPLVVLAYSGGLDTSAIVPWLRETYGARVVCELTYAALAPELQIIAPWREWKFQGREDLIAYVHAKGVPVQATAAKPYSTDRNLWHCSHEGGILEDPSQEAPEHIFVMTKN